MDPIVETEVLSLSDADVTRLREMDAQVSDLVGRLGPGEAEPPPPAAHRRVLVRNASGETAPARGLVHVQAHAGDTKEATGRKCDYSGRFIGVLPGVDTPNGGLVGVVLDGPAAVQIAVPVGATVRNTGTTGAGIRRAGPMAGSWYAQPDQLGVLKIIQVYDPDTTLPAASWTNSGASPRAVLADVEVTRQKGDYRIVVDQTGKEIGTFTDLVFDPSVYAVTVTDFGVPKVELA